MEKALNCWEYMLCGREIGGGHVDECGVCPAATDTTLTGIHGGKNGGRACWAVAGTVCEGNIQCSFARKGRNSCGRCDFYHIVKKEEGDKLMPTIFLLRKLDGMSHE